MLISANRLIRTLNTYKATQRKLPDFFEGGFIEEENKSQIGRAPYLYNTESELQHTYPTLL